MAQKAKSCLRFLNKVLPIEEESKEWIDSIKTGITLGILLSDEYSIVWLKELRKFISIFGRNFTKEEHLYFINILYNFCFTDNLDLRIVSETSKTLILLLE